MSSKELFATEVASWLVYPPLVATQDGTILRYRVFMIVVKMNSSYVNWQFSVRTALL